MQKHFAEVLMTACSLGLRLTGEAGDLCMAIVQIIEYWNNTIHGAIIPCDYFHPGDHSIQDFWENTLLGIR